MPERYLSPAMHDEQALSLLIAPLVGVEAKIYNGLWNAIIDTRLRPGAKLDEAALCEIYGVSRTIVRKVMLVMEQEGIVSLPANRGAYVVLPTSREARELNEAVTVIMRLVATRLAADPGKIAAVSRRKLEAHLAAERTASAEQDFRTMRRYRVEFMTLLALVHGNRVMAATVERYAVRYAIALAAYAEPGSTEDGLAFAEGFVAAILAGDGASAVQVLETHMLRTSKLMRFSVGGDAVDLRAVLGRPNRRITSPA